MATNYDRLKKQARETRDAKIAAAKAECAKALEALELVRRMDEGVGKNGRAGTSGRESSQRIARGVLSRHIEEALSSVSASFTTQHIINVIVVAHPELVGVIPKPSVASALARLVAAGKIELMEPGRGRRHAVFVRQIEEG